MASYGTALFPAVPTGVTFGGSYPGTQAVPGASEFSGQSLTPENNLYPGSATFAGQGLLPMVLLRISFDGVGVSTPTWVYVADAKFRGYSVDRGRAAAHGDFDTGTCSLTLDNRDRAYDPFNNSLIRPGNRVWLIEQFSGETNDLFFGYVNSWGNDWPAFADAEAHAQCSDEFKPLTVSRLPTTDPPRDSYTDLANSDGPIGQWTLNDDPLTRQRVPLSEASASPGEELPPPKTELRRAFPMKHPPRPRRRHG